MARRIVHVDVYRLDHLQELHDVGWDDLLDGESIALVEWGDRVTGLLPADRLDVHLEFGAATGDDDDERTMSFEPSGASWSRACRRVGCGRRRCAAAGRAEGV